MPNEPLGTIQLTPGQTPRLGETVTFDVTFSPDNLDQSSHPGGVRVNVYAYNEEGDLLYLEGRHYDSPFLLGAGSSKWVEVGGSAHCRAELFYWGKEKGVQTFNLLASCTFEALDRA